MRIAEVALNIGDGQFPLTEAVAKNLHKLMAYKDEYEVARLYADPAFFEKLKSSFEGDWKPKLPLAPPLFSKKDANGHLIKKQYGPWIFSAMRVLATPHFAVSQGVVVTLEDYGFCERGQSGPFVQSGATALGGSLPVNTHGGFLSEGYVHGLNHVCEAVSQLRVQAGPRQVSNARLALVTAQPGLAPNRNSSSSTPRRARRSAR